MATLPLNYEQFLSNQNKMMDSWMDATKKMMGAFQPSEDKKEPTDLMERGQGLLTDWYNEQRRIMDEAMQVNSPQAMMEKAPKAYQKMMETQLNFAEKWSELYREMAQGMGMQLPEMEGYNKMVKNSFGQVDNWLNTSMKFFQDQLKPMMPNGMGTHLDNFVSAYTQMNRYWEPMQQAIMKGITREDVLQTWMKPESYQEMVNSLMGFNPIGNLSGMVTETNKFFDGYRNWYEEQFEDGKNFLSRSMDNFTPFDSSAWFRMFTQVNEQMNQMYSPFTVMADKSKNGETLRLSRELQYDYINFLVKITELQSHFYEVSNKVLPLTIQEQYESYQQSKTLPEYDTFFKAFVEKLEAHMIALFETEEYARLQNEVATAGVKVKNNLTRMMELNFDGMPFASRSEASELAKEIQSLRRKIRGLEKKLNEPAPQPAPKAAPKATKTTRKRTTVSKK
jgi:hypothetical protein